jgi:2-oxoglutarate ferredoxin oxidoreductase subunit alpha
MIRPSAPDARGVLPREIRDAVVIRFAGDSGDGMQLTGTQFSLEAALAGSDIATFPDYPAEIRAPAGTTYGVSAFQLHFGGGDLTTPGDEPDVLVALNPAALKVNYADLRVGGLVVVDTGAFTKRNLEKAGYTTSPLDDATLAPYQVLKLDITTRTADAVEPFGLGAKAALRSRNMWTLGLMLWMFGQDRAVTAEWIARKFAKEPVIAEANVAALTAGYAFGDTVEMSSELVGYTVAKAEVAPGVYRTVTGTETTAWGLITGARGAGLDRILFGSYPITPASPLLHTMARLKAYGVILFQAEDEIAAICAAIGGSYAGSLGVTSSSGPGIALKGEALGLAVAAELPLVVVNSQRAGPSTGLPTKTEQSDLYQAVYGRNGDTPLPVLAAATPADCYEVAIEAVRLAVTYMTPVIMLIDGYLANAAEPWLLPDAADAPSFPVRHHTETEGFQPFARDPKTLARPWAIPGTPGLTHRIGGIERDATTGHISYAPDNHQRMTDLRHQKIAGIANGIPEQEVQVGERSGRMAIVAWGSTYGPIYQAVKQLRGEGARVSHLHLRYLNPFPRNLGELLAGFDRVLVPEMNAGQLVTMLRSTYLVPAEGLNQVTGKPFKVADIANAIRARLED